MRTSPIIALALCLAFASANLYQADFTLTQDDVFNFQVKKGDLLRVTLKEIPSTGYVWRFQNPKENNLGIYSVQMDDYSSPKSADEENPVGTAGKRTIVLRAENEGQEEFELILVRSWEYKDFVETTTSNGQTISMKDVPNVAQYKKVVISVQATDWFNIYTLKLTIIILIRNNLIP